MMGRGYTRARYLELVALLRQAQPQLSLTTDIIVGFPGETEDDFVATLSLVEAIRFDGAFTFAYSALPGTRAHAMRAQVSEDVKRSRLRRLIDLQKHITEQNNDKRVGRTYEVLVEGTSVKDPHECAGRTRGGQVVVFPGKSCHAGDFVNVLVTGGGCWALRGEVV
jgi:tRNA-2-methylthio-N6-dimethylallyladenosine synthase